MQKTPLNYKNKVKNRKKNIRRFRNQSVRKIPPVALSHNN